MRPLAEMLSVLATAQTSDDAAESLRRVLRCPSVWSALRDDGVLERGLEMKPGPLTPGRVLLAASGYTHFSDLSTLPTAAENTASTSDPDPDGSTRVLLGRVAQVVHEAADPSALMPEILGAPPLWSEALACAWEELPGR
ncbi:MAG TPA: hypothetical protein VFI11_09390, partial [Anaerolineales bacterium]|nr:hypothetical protein [Anaerolineales bacterium]